MRKFLLQFQLENKFLYKNWFFLITPILYLVIASIWIGNRTNYPYNDFFRISYEFLSLGHTLTLGVVFLASVLSIRRDTQTELLEWMNTLPHSYISKLSAKFISIFLYTNMFSLCFFIPYFLFGLSHAEFTTLQTHSINIFIQSQLSYSVTIALGMTLASFITHRIVYIIVFCAWMFGTFFMEGYVIERYDMFFLKVFHLNKFFMSNPLQSEWAVNLQQTEKLYTYMFVVGFTIILFVVTLLKLMCKRLMNNKITKVVSICLVALIASSSFLPYSFFWKERVENYHHLMNGVKAHSNNDLILFSTDSYVININRKQDTIYVEAEVKIKKTNQKPFTFTLYPQFQIEEVRWNGKRVKHTRDFHLITFQEEQLEENTLVVKYFGELDEWTSIGNRERLFAFIKGADMYLPSYIAWYPIVGHYPIFYFDPYSPTENLSLSNLYNIHAFSPSDFHVTLTGFDHDVFGTYDKKELKEPNTMVFQSNNKNGLSLFAMEGLTETHLPSVPLSIITKEEQMEKLLKDSIQLKGIHDYLNQWLPIQNSTPTIISIPGLHFTGSDPYYANTRDGSLFYDMEMEIGYYHYDDWIDQTADYYLTEIINAFLFPEHPKSLYGDYVPYREDSVKVGIAHGYILLTLIDFFEKDWDYFNHYYSRSHYMLNELGNIIWISDNEDISNKERIEKILKSSDLSTDSRVMFEIALALEEGKDEQVKEVLAYFYDEILETTYISYQEWRDRWAEVENNIN